eukprot:1073596-Pyramimonas_sp.AAC.1
MEVGLFQASLNAAVSTFTTSPSACPAKLSGRTTVTSGTPLSAPASDRGAGEGAYEIWQTIVGYQQERCVGIPGGGLRVKYPAGSDEGKHRSSVVSLVSLVSLRTRLKGRKVFLQKHLQGVLYIV